MLDPVDLVKKTKNLLQERKAKDKNKRKFLESAVDFIVSDIDNFAHADIVGDVDTRYKKDQVKIDITPTGGGDKLYVVVKIAHKGPFIEELNGISGNVIVKYWSEDRGGENRLRAKYNTGMEGFTNPDAFEIFKNLSKRLKRNSNSERFDEYGI